MAPVSPFTKEVMRVNSEKLEVVALQVDSYDQLAELPDGDFPAMQKLVICGSFRVGGPVSESNRAYLQAKYPKVKIKFIPRFGVGVYAFHYLRYRGLDHWDD